MEHYFHPEIECASRDQIRAWQDERLVKTVRRVYDNVAYYRRLMDEKGVQPATSSRWTTCICCPF